jgi:hypothetical protein
LSLKKNNDNREAKRRCNQPWAETAECGRDKSSHNEKEEGRLPVEKGSMAAVRPAATPADNTATA